VKPLVRVSGAARAVPSGVSSGSPGRAAGIWGFGVGRVIDSPSSRRSFLTRAGLAAGAFAATFGLPSGALGGTPGHRKRVWKLAPDGPHYDCRRSQKAQDGCHGCNACQSHAENKLFASEEAAKRDRHRAHPGCRCGVRRGRKLSRHKWRELFRPDGDKKHVVVDKRDPRVRRILDLKD
jgi:hypothetical protein